VEELAARIRNRSTIYYSQDDYDAILPSIESQRVHLAGGDIDLMWNLFDYASISNGIMNLPMSGVQKHFSETDQQKEQNCIDPQLSSELSTTATPSDDYEGPMPTQVGLQPPDIPLTGTENTLFDPDSFADLPEEWMMNDWTLFGAPLSAYHS
jgi:hypothetical protein